MSRLLVLYLCSLLLRSLLIGCAGIATSLVLRNVAWRHAVLVTALGCMLLLPLADALLPQTAVISPLPENLALPLQELVIVATGPWLPQAAQHVSVPAAGTAMLNAWDFVTMALAGVAGVLLLRQFLALLQVWRLKRRSMRLDAVADKQALRIGGSALPVVLESRDVVTPLTIGLLKPALILPREWRTWDAWKLHAVILHELAHVQRRDWAIAVITAFARCLFWFNPLIWWIGRRLSLLAEQACDEASVHILGDAPRYAETLLDFASGMRRGHRWIGGIAMAQHRISQRIHRVLALRHPGSGLLARPAWFALSILFVPVVYFAAVKPEAVSAEIPALSAAEVFNAVKSRLPVPQQIAMAQTPVQSPPVNPQPEPPAMPGGAKPSVGQQIDPDLVGEIRLILTPVEVQGTEGVGGRQVQITTRTGTGRYTGSAIWNVQNPAGINRFTRSKIWNVQNPALNPAAWGQNSFIFMLTGFAGRTAYFERNQEVFSYECADCSFQVSEAAVGSPNAAQPGIVFRLSEDGLSMTATCRAVECRAGVNSQLNSNPASGLFAGTSVMTLRDGQTFQFGILQSPNPAPRGLTCFSVFGAMKRDGTPFTAADCPGGNNFLPEVILFSVTR